MLDVLEYRLIMFVIWLAIPVLYVWRMMTGKDSMQTFVARLGFGARTGSNEKLIWLHAASVGELNTLKLVRSEISVKLPDYDQVITVSNRLAFIKAQPLSDANTHVVIAPMDFVISTRRFLNRWKPACMITIENEVYPNRILLLKKREIPIIFINARMSDKSYISWAKNIKFAQRVFGCIDYCFAQDQKSLQHFSELGVADAQCELLENLKKFHATPTVTHPDMTRISSAFPKPFTMCAASTHKGEDQVILDAFSQAKRQTLALKLILVPRHPKRLSEIETHLKAAGYKYAVRSRSELPTATDDIYIADTLGEMPLWYCGAAVTFVAGSLVGVGGHTPFEPAAFGSAIIHGPQYSNFQIIYENLLRNNGSIQASNAAEIATAWGYLLDTKKRAAQVQIATETLLDTKNKTQILKRITDKIAALLS
jgi:3-deoxy-D-manno-octulosonic-acid transferase